MELATRRGVTPRRILDVGTGTGYLLRQLAERLPDTAAFVGVDPAQEMVRVAGAAASDRRLTFSIAAAEHLPFADGVFDLVVSTTSFDHWTDQQAGLRECARVLAGGGQLLLTDQFSRWLLPTLVFGRHRKARTKRRVSAMAVTAGFHSVEWLDRSVVIIRTLVATA